MDVRVADEGNGDGVEADSRSDGFLTEGFQQEMKKIDNCTGCGHCKEHCPYKLDTPALLKRQQAEFFEMIKDRE